MNEKGLCNLMQNIESGRQKLNNIGDERQKLLSYPVSSLSKSYNMGVVPVLESRTVLYVASFVLTAGKTTFLESNVYLGRNVSILGWNV